MKTFLKFSIAAIAALFILSACEKDDFGTWTATTVCSHTISSNERLAEALKYVKTFEYFTKTHPCEAKYSEAREKSAEEFATACDSIDEDTLESFMEYGESFTIVLVIAERGDIVGTCTWVKDDFPTE